MGGFGFSVEGLVAIDGNGAGVPVDCADIDGRSGLGDGEIGRDVD